MMRARFELCRAALVVVFVALLTICRPIPSLDLDELTKGADLIVTGQLSGVREVGREVLVVENERVPVRVMTAELRADHVLKGLSQTSSLDLRFFLPEAATGWTGAQPLQYRLFFLKAVVDHFEFLSPYYPSTVAVPGVAVVAGNALDRVVQQIAAVLVSPSSSVGQKHEAIYALSRTKDRAAAQALKIGLRSSELTLRLSSAAALLERNDLSGLQIAEEALLNPQPGVPEYLLHNLTYGISEGVADEKAVPSLTRLLASGNPKTRRAAASALRHTNSHLAVDPLISALPDADLEVRYYAVVGLAEITGQTEWRPNMDDFRLDEQRYLKHWRNWARGR